ncbi:ABC transporter ATP-binding protein [Georgenia sp. SYP-B2076]|uniref:ABC transporter ATP-binding protein n=1 Tax=Georgenia sp. SYP-B2076 TaxID=2495881 RepID=UPI0013DF24DD|nr:ABC transporter ATP-binding protein [Georgenia sp. SYP-B2076]
MTQHDPALEVTGLEVRYSGVPAVKGISFTVGRGETVGLIGPNGAGKSSTLQALMGAVRSTGTVRLAGTDITGLAPENVIRRGLALVPEGRHIFGDLSVRNNLRLGLVGRRDSAGSTEDLDGVLELFPILREFESRAAGLLSGGQQQQLAIGRALLARPDVLMLDEPSLGLSPTAVDTVFEALQAVRAQGTSVLVVEQRAEFTIAFADRTYVLHDGEITLELSPEAAGDEDLLTKAYFGS